MNGDTSHQTAISRHTSSCSRCSPVMMERRSKNIWTLEDFNDDPFKGLAQSKSAHASEHAILRMFWWLWIALGGFGRGDPSESGTWSWVLGQ